MKHYFKILLIVLCLCQNNLLKAQTPSKKEIIGCTANVRIKNGDIDFLGRVDTGAETTSINAENIKAIGDSVRFTIINQRGKKTTLTAKIIEERTVKNAEAAEKRYFVYLTISYLNVSKITLVNLNNRSNSTYKILLGRNWLSGSYLVDVDID